MTEELENETNKTELIGFADAFYHIEKLELFFLQSNGKDVEQIIFLSTLVNVFQDDSNLSTFLSTCIIKLNKEMDFVKLKNEKNPDYLYFKLLISLCFFKISQKTNKYLPHIMNIFIENLKFFFSVFQSSKSENFAYNTNHLTLSNAICTTLKLIGMYIKFGIKNRKFSPIQIEEYINKLNPHYYENSSIQKRLQKTIKIIKIGKLPSKVSKRKHTAIKMLEPKLNFDEPLENTKLKPKKKIIDRLRIKREKRCAIKEIRRDNALINNEKFKTILENDNIRMKKVNKIMEQLKTQEHEFKKSK
ncbi:hypothetical protein A3Q56_06515 [Intoshia linei]|uniref:Uncharacterized protein n=1 Tax=Intoshia linei TaxID=1819745 RepID=A0A177AW83_9BILA|nr:hypothetical protein A3Q56_06515 [Intoshia linei]